LKRVTVAVEGEEPENRALRQALAALGCHLEAQWRPGIPAFQSSHGGFRLTARDERGTLLDSGQLLALVCLIEMENGGGRVAVPPGSSAAVELVAAGYGGTVFRLDRDGPSARQLYANLPWLREAPSAAIRICSRMGASGQTLAGLISKTPRFSVWKREVPLTADRGQVMQVLARTQNRQPRGEGLRLHTGGGWVYLAPLTRRAALRVMAEGPDLELAAELCDFYAGQVSEADRAISEQSSQESPNKE
jgi:mannose-1-phosphate guanylyltransferase/phosphomannomutase